MATIWFIGLARQSCAGRKPIIRSWGWNETQGPLIFQDEAHDKVNAYLPSLHNWLEMGNWSKSCTQPHTLLPPTCKLLFHYFIYILLFCQNWFPNNYINITQAMHQDPQRGPWLLYSVSCSLIDGQQNVGRGEPQIDPRMMVVVGKTALLVPSPNSSLWCRAPFGWWPPHIATSYNTGPTLSATWSPLSGTDDNKFVIASCSENGNCKVKAVLSIFGIGFFSPLLTINLPSSVTFGNLTYLQGEHPVELHSGHNVMSTSLFTVLKESAIETT